MLRDATVHSPATSGIDYVRAHRMKCMISMTNVRREPQGWVASGNEDGKQWFKTFLTKREAIADRKERVKHLL